MAEIVYILTNKAFPNLVKVGRTKDLKKRVRVLSSYSSTPYPFECYYACEVERGRGAEIEDRLKGGFADYRVNPKREFFEVKPEFVKKILEGWEIKNVTPDVDDTVEDKADAETLKRAGSRKSVFRFSMVDIRPGTKLTFSEDKSITCRVVDDRKVEFEGKTTSLHKVTLHILNTYCGRNSYSVRGQNHWLYRGETLTDRRDRMEKSKK
ncbi:GIY-YIG nuclease family protein [Thioalkalivibrio sp. HK1]|uniref:GIY-YIG nuclease family protein n=1 Tax=Thioalkalivibrio sp. HK1 TaxID=1469245 RepID=UPI0009DE8767|nr:GIY-YIG nuclease family protein [Thioalkalivibrio sp. HK1]